MAIVAASTPSESEESAEESSDGSVDREAAMEMSPEKYSPFHEVEETQNATVRKYIHSEEEEKEEEEGEKEEKKEAGEADESKETKEQSNKEESNKEASDQAISADPSASRPPTDPNQPLAEPAEPLAEPAEPLVEPAEPLVEPVNPSAPSTSSVPLSASLPQSPRSPLPLSASLTRASDSLSPSPPSPFLLQRAPIDLPPSNSIPNSISNPAARWLPVALCSVELLSQAISVPFSLSLSLSAPHLRTRHRRGSATHSLQSATSPKDHHRLQRALPRPVRTRAHSLALHAGVARDAAVPPASGRGDLLGSDDDFLVRRVETVAVLQERAGIVLREGRVSYAGQYRNVQTHGSIPDGTHAPRNASRHSGEAQRARESLPELRLRRLLPQHHLHSLLHRGLSLFAPHR